MIFNSIEFLIFLISIFFLYWVFKKNNTIQNIIILSSSYLFYGWWDWRFLFLILASTVVDYFVGLRIGKTKSDSGRITLLWISILFNLGILGFFKYFNFFIDSWVDILSIFGYELESKWTLNIILPVGISFYTFQTMSYCLDIYYKKIEPNNDFIAFAAFVSFFPQLVAGPIERAANLLPQFLSKREFKYEQGVSGLRLILWGMFKKVVIADSLASRVNYPFEYFDVVDGGVLLLGLIYFAFQIYCDFSGYSDIAIGTAKLFGIEIITNFNYPFFSRDIAEFWRRWHISLSDWFKDYLYMPVLIRCRNFGMMGILFSTLICYTVIGLWHGANNTFIVFGIIHSLFFFPIIIFKKKPHKYKFFESKNVFDKFKDVLFAIKTFLYFSLSLVFFRSQTVSDAASYLLLMIKNFTIPIENRSGIIYILIVMIFECLFLLYKIGPRNPLNFPNKYARFILYIFLLYLIFSHFQFVDLSQFIYFQF